MSKMKYLLLLFCVGLVCVASPLLAATVTIESWPMDENPGWTLDTDSDWAYGVPTGKGGDADSVGKDPTGGPDGTGIGAPVVGTNVLGTTLTGNYSADAAEFATSTEVDCTGFVGVMLTFSHWLNVQDAIHDQATVEVSNDGGGSWTIVWTNTADENNIETVWSMTQVDLSAVADNQETVQVRFGMTSDATVQFGGWNIALVDMIATRDNAHEDEFGTASWDLADAASVLDFKLNWDREGSGQLAPDDRGWEVGPAVHDGGQPLVDPDTGDFVPVDDRTGADPEEDADGVVGGNVVGYVIGGNYQGGLKERYLTSPIMNFELSRAVKFNFARWLQVQDGLFSHVAVQINNEIDLDSGDPAFDEIFAADFDGDDPLADWDIGGQPVPPGPQVIDTAPFSTDDLGVELRGTQRISMNIDTTDLYEIRVFADIATKFTDATIESIVVEWTADYSDGADAEWNVLFTSSGQIPDLISIGGVDGDGEPLPITIARGAGAENNPDFGLRFRLTGDSNTKDFGYVDNVLVEGNLWTTLFQNPIETPAVGIFDDSWQDKSLDLSESVDGVEDGVRVRFVMGPTVTFIPKLGQSPIEVGGWSLDNLEFAEGTFAWRPEGTDFPTALTWGEGADVTITGRNVGTGYWDDTFALRAVAGATIPDDMTRVISRWVTNEIDVEDVVPSAETFDFSDSITAPPLSTFTYKLPIETEGKALAQDPTRADRNNLGLDWNLEHEADSGDFLPLYDGRELHNGSLLPDALPLSVAHGLVTIDRFPDILPDTDGFWARFWVEELAGRVPFIVQGFPDGTYRPLVELDRAAIAVYIQRAAGLPLDLEVEQSRFLDVPDDFWALLQIEACAVAKIVQGIPPLYATYQPTTLVTRSQMAKFIANGAAVAGLLPPGIDIVPGVQPPLPAEKPFPDVPLQLRDADGNLVDNTLAAYIEACRDADIVQGYPDGTYRPNLTITRDQLAVYVWRAFIRPSGSAVVLGGPAITSSNPATVGYFGLRSRSSGSYTAETMPDSALSITKRYMYVVFDAVRLADQLHLDNVATPSPTWEVRFELRDPDTPTGSPDELTDTGCRLIYPFHVSQAELSDAIADALSTGIPYFTLAQLMDPGIPSAPMHGDFLFTVAVKDGSDTWRDALRQHAFKAYGQIFFENFEATIAGWTYGGSPGGGPNITDAAFGLGLDNDVGTTNPFCAEFTGTQVMTQSIPTLDRHNISVSAWLGASNLSSSQLFRVQYSTDGGENWTTLETADGDPFELSDVEEIDPDDQELEQFVSTVLPSTASDNPNFMLRVQMNGTTDSSFGYIDNILIKGT